jgi:predicted ATP-binding protein involved in virulence
MIFVIGLAVVIGSIMVTSAGSVMIAIYSPSDGDTVYTDKIAVFGGARGTEGAIVESVTVNGLLADGTISWSKDISLQPGQNKITAVATDNMGQSISKTISVTYIASTPSPAPTTPPPLPTTIQTGGHGPTPAPIPTPIPTPTGSISITTTPSGAEVYLDNSFAGITPITLEDVTVGYHKATVSKEGYHSQTSEIYLSTGKTKELNIELEPITGSIAVSSTPSGASVYLDDVDMNKITPCMLSEVAVGQHTIKLTKSGYSDLIRNVSVSVGRTSHLHENLSAYGSIDISSDPSGADVYLDGNYTGETTPKNISKVVVGDHTIKLTKFGYDDVTRNVSISVGETLHLHENLAGFGSLRIFSYPSEAKVYLDGDYMGKTPLDISKVVEGSHTYKLTKFGYASVEKTIDVSAGESRLVDETLSVPWEVLNISIIVVVIVIMLLVLLINVKAPRRKRDALSKSIMKEEDIRPHVESRQKIDFAKRKDIILLNSQEWTKHKDYAKINPLYKKAQELEKRGENKESIEAYKEIIDINEYYIKAWEGLERYYTVLGESEKRDSALKKKRSITEFIDFATNAAQKINLQQFNLQNLDFFDNLFWSFKPQINILLGKNGYGKTYLLRLLISLLQKDDDISSEFFKGKKSNSFVRCDLERNNDAKVIYRTKTIFEESIGKVPVLAIPDMRLVDKSRTKIEPIILDTEIRESGAYHFLYEKPFEEVIQNFLYELCIRYMDKGKSFEQPLFQLLHKVVRELTDKEFEFNEIEAIGSAKFEIKVITEGNPEKPLPLQRASQGTLSVLSIFGLIYYYLTSVFPDTPEEEILKKPAIVFIDELDAHLHPSWQQRIIGLLRDSFPNVQFIVTAHSPLVVAGCYENEVAVLRKGENGFTIENIEEHFIGTPTCELLKKLFETEDIDDTYLYYTTQLSLQKANSARMEKLKSKEPLKAAEEEELNNLYKYDYYVNQIAKFEKEKQEQDCELKIMELEAKIRDLEFRLNNKEPQ